VINTDRPHRFLFAYLSREKGFNMEEEIIRLYYLIKNKPIHLHRNGKVYVFAPSCEIPVDMAKKLLANQVSTRGCCGKPSRTFHVFATDEQLQSGERTWIE